MNVKTNLNENLFESRAQSIYELVKSCSFNDMYSICYVGLENLDIDINNLYFIVLYIYYLKKIVNIDINYYDDLYYNISPIFIYSEFNYDMNKHLENDEVIDCLFYVLFTNYKNNKQVTIDKLFSIINDPDIYTNEDTVILHKMEKIVSLVNKLKIQNLSMELWNIYTQNVIDRIEYCYENSKEEPKSTKSNLYQMIDLIKFSQGNPSKFNVTSFLREKLEFDQVHMIKMKLIDHYTNLSIQLLGYLNRLSGNEEIEINSFFIEKLFNYKFGIQLDVPSLFKGSKKLDESAFSLIKTPKAREEVFGGRILVNTDAMDEDEYSNLIDLIIYPALRVADTIHDFMNKNTIVDKKPYLLNNIRFFIDKSKLKSTLQTKFTSTNGYTLSELFEILNGVKDVYYDLDENPASSKININPLDCINDKTDIEDNMTEQINIFSKKIYTNSSDKLKEKIIKTYRLNKFEINQIVEKMNSEQPKFIVFNKAEILKNNIFLKALSKIFEYISRSILGSSSSIENTGILVIKKEEDKIGKDVYDSIKSLFKNRTNIGITYDMGPQGLRLLEIIEKYESDPKNHIQKKDKLFSVPNIVTAELWDPASGKTAARNRYPNVIDTVVQIEKGLLNINNNDNFISICSDKQELLLEYLYPETIKAFWSKHGSKELDNFNKIKQGSQMITENKYGEINEMLKLIQGDIDKSCDYFYIKNSGDWGQVNSAKYNDMVLFTKDRLCHHYAVLTDTSCVYHHDYKGTHDVFLIHSGEPSLNLLKIINNLRNLIRIPIPLPPNSREEQKYKSPYIENILIQFEHKTNADIEANIFDATFNDDFIKNIDKITSVKFVTGFKKITYSDDIVKLIEQEIVNTGDVTVSDIPKLQKLNDDILSHYNNCVNEINKVLEGKLKYYVENIFSEISPEYHDKITKELITKIKNSPHIDITAGYEHEQIIELLKGEHVKEILKNFVNKEFLDNETQYLVHYHSTGETIPDILKEPYDNLFTIPDEIIINEPCVNFEITNNQLVFASIIKAYIRKDNFVYIKDNFDYLVVSLMNSILELKEVLETIPTPYKEIITSIDLKFIKFEKDGDYYKLKRKESFGNNIEQVNIYELILKCIKYNYDADKLKLGIPTNQDNVKKFFTLGQLIYRNVMKESTKISSFSIKNFANGDVVIYNDSDKFVLRKLNYPNIHYLLEELYNELKKINNSDEQQKSWQKAIDGFIQDIIDDKKDSQKYFEKNSTTTINKRKYLLILFLTYLRPQFRYQEYILKPYDFYNTYISDLDFTIKDILFSEGFLTIQLQTKLIKSTIINQKLQIINFLYYLNNPLTDDLKYNETNINDSYDELIDNSDTKVDTNKIIKNINPKLSSYNTENGLTIELKMKYNYQNPEQRIGHLHSILKFKPVDNRYEDCLTFIKRTEIKEPVEDVTYSEYQIILNNIEKNYYYNFETSLITTQKHIFYVIRFLKDLWDVIPEPMASILELQDTRIEENILKNIGGVHQPQVSYTGKKKTQTIDSKVNFNIKTNSNSELYSSENKKTKILYGVIVKNKEYTPSLLESLITKLGFEGTINPEDTNLLNYEDILLVLILFVNIINNNLELFNVCYKDMLISIKNIIEPIINHFIFIYNNPQIYYPIDYFNIKIIKNIFDKLSKLKSDNLLIKKVLDDLKELTITENKGYINAIDKNFVIRLQNSEFYKNVININTIISSNFNEIVERVPEKLVHPVFPRTLYSLIYSEPGPSSQQHVKSELDDVNVEYIKSMKKQIESMKKQIDNVNKQKLEFEIEKKPFIDEYNKNLKDLNKLNNELEELKQKKNKTIEKIYTLITHSQTLKQELSSAEIGEKDLTFLQTIDDYVKTFGANLLIEQTKAKKQELRAKQLSGEDLTESEKELMKISTARIGLASEDLFKKVKITTAAVSSKISTNNDEIEKLIIENNSLDAQIAIKEQEVLKIQSYFTIEVTTNYKTVIANIKNYDDMIKGLTKELENLKKN